MSERDTTSGGGSSPYDEPTGEIETQPGAGPTPEPPPVGPRPTAGEALTRKSATPRGDRDSFFAKHATRRDPSVSRVDELDDIDPDEVDTRSGTRRRPAPDSSAPDAPVPAADDPSSPTAAEPTVAFGALPPVGDTSVPEPATHRFAAPERRDPADDLGADDVRTEAFATDEPLPHAYSDPVATGGVPVVGDDPEIDPHRSDRRVRVLEDELEDAEKDARRGTLDIGLLVIRLAVGAILVAHGAQKLFGLWNGPRLSGFEDLLVNSANPAIGFNPDFARPLAIGGAVTETVSGLMLIVGLFTPLAAAGALGVMLVAGAYKATLAGGVWFFAADPNGSGIEYELLLAVCAAALILTGPGRISIDAPRGWARRPSWGSLGLLVVGIGAAVAVWLLLNGTNPFNSPGNPTG